MHRDYPEWGPAKHRHEEERPYGAEPAVATLDQRDASGERPDDN